MKELHEMNEIFKRHKWGGVNLPQTLLTRSTWSMQTIWTLSFPHILWGIPINWNTSIEPVWLVLDLRVCFCGRIAAWDTLWFPLEHQALGELTTHDLLSRGNHIQLGLANFGGRINHINTHYCHIGGDPLLKICTSGKLSSLADYTKDDNFIKSIFFWTILQSCFSG